MKTCLKCKKEYKEEYDFCPQCGKPYDSSKKPPKLPKVYDSTTFMKWGIFGLLIALVLLIFILILSNANKPKVNPESVVEEPVVEEPVVEEPTIEEPKVEEEKTPQTTVPETKSEYDVAMEKCIIMEAADIRNIDGGGANIFTTAKSTCLKFRTMYYTNAEFIKDVNIDWENRKTETLDGKILEEYLGTLD